MDSTRYEWKSDWFPNYKNITNNWQLEIFTTCRNYFQELYFSWLNIIKYPQTTRTHWSAVNITFTIFNNLEAKPHLNDSRCYYLLDNRVDSVNYKETNAEKQHDETSKKQIIVYHNDGGSMDIVSYKPPRWLTRLRIHNHNCPQFSFYIEP